PFTARLESLNLNKSQGSTIKLTGALMGASELKNVKVHFKIKGDTIEVEECLDTELCTGMAKLNLIEDSRVEPLEAAHQAALGRAAVDGVSGWEAVVNVLQTFKIKLGMFLVYHDLRRRGRRVKRGARSGTLIVDLGREKLAEILVLEEGTPMTLEKLAEWSRGASASNHEPIVAIVDRAGVISYYEARATSHIS
ncbi:MAG: SEN2-like domain-containing protein, partial [Acidilobaceae archaeon]